MKNRKTYQISSFHPNDALECALRDEKEGADILMVKPAGLYTDTWTALTRSGAAIIISYASRNAKNWINELEY